MSQVKGGEQTGSLAEPEQSRDEPPCDHTKNDRDCNTERSPETNEARELRIEIIRKEGQRVRALRMKVSHFFNSMNNRSPNQFQPVILIRTYLYVTFGTTWFCEPVQKLVKSGERLKLVNSGLVRTIWFLT